MKNSIFLYGTLFTLSIIMLNISSAIVIPIEEKNYSTMVLPPYGILFMDKSWEFHENIKDVYHRSNHGLENLGFKIYSYVYRNIDDFIESEYHLPKMPSILYTDIFPLVRIEIIVDHYCISRELSDDIELDFLNEIVDDNNALKYGTGIVHRIDLGSKLVIDLQVTRNFLQKYEELYHIDKYHYNKILQIVGISFIDASFNYKHKGKYFDELYDIAVREKNSFSLIDFTVMGRSYEGNIQEWVERNTKPVESNIINIFIDPYHRIMRNNKNIPTIMYSKWSYILRNFRKNLFDKLMCYNRPKYSMKVPLIELEDTKSSNRPTQCGGHRAKAPIVW